MFPATLPRPPAPARLLGTLDSLLPATVKRQLVEPLLNRVFAEPLAEGEFDALEGRRIALCIEDLDMSLTLGMQARRLTMLDAKGESVIRGGWREFLCLATRKEDPDSLFFQRRLVIEGDTELGLMVKNLLDSREEGVIPAQLGEWLYRLEALSRRESR
ncbi:phosphatidic acid-binding protein [Halomonas shantousis]